MSRAVGIRGDRCTSFRLAATAALLLLSVPPAGAGSILTRFYLQQGPRCAGAAFRRLGVAKNAFGGSLLMSPPATQGASATNIYGATITRVGGVTGGAFSATGSGVQGTVPWNNNLSGNWGGDSRHHYTKDTPFNADGTLFFIENPATTEDSTGASVANTSQTGATSIILRTSDWTPLTYGQCVAGGDSIRDRRWDLNNPLWMIVLKQSTSGAGNDTTGSTQGGDYVGIVDVSTCQIVRRTPIHAEGGNRIIKANLIGASEGQVTSDSRCLLLLALHRQHNQSRPDSMQVVDLLTMTLGAPFEVPPCSLDVEASPDGFADCNIGHATLSPNGTKAIVLYASDDLPTTSVDTTDAVRVFDVSGTTITGIHGFARDSVWRGPTNNGVRALCATSMIGSQNTILHSTGWISNLKHAILISDPFTGHEAIVGGQRCGRSGNEGQVEMVDLSTGRMKRLTGSDGTFTESSFVHASTAYRMPGYAFCSYDEANGTLPQAEVIVVRTDGSGALIRLLETRTRDVQYSAEAHPSPSLDGRRLAWASNWVLNCSVCGNQTQPKSYVADWGSFCLP